jgi:hypothetical protein
MVVVAQLGRAKASSFIPIVNARSCSKIPWSCFAIFKHSFDCGEVFALEDSSILWYHHHQLDLLLCPNFIIPILHHSSIHQWTIGDFLLPQRHAHTSFLSSQHHHPISESSMTHEGVQATNKRKRGVESLFD